MCELFEKAARTFLEYVRQMPKDIKVEEKWEFHLQSSNRE